ncbi:hypothetical protein CAL7716_103180 (plasmid) [Calothrix sp. PCC 7716]|nr:hypothetical protein CAL7716_103180 [Calothrix sp. PCC 7716]
MTQKTIQPQFLMQFDQCKYTKKSNELVPPYEIDSVFDKDFGKLYRVWKSYRLLGTFYKALDGKWIVQPVNATVNGRFNTSNQVILLIIAIDSNPQLQQTA